MDNAILPLILVALVAAMYSTWQELRASLQPTTCSECPHCRAALADRQAIAREDARRRAEMQTWQARRNGPRRRDGDDRS